MIDNRKDMAETQKSEHREMWQTPQMKRIDASEAESGLTDPSADGTFAVS